MDEKVLNRIAKSISIRWFIVVIYLSVIVVISFQSTSFAEQENKPVEVENATLADFDAVKNAKYSTDCELALSADHLPLVMKKRGRGEISFAVNKKGVGYLPHGFIKKYNDKDRHKSIPVDQHPQALIKFPPKKKGESPIVQRFHLKQRC